MLKKNNSGYTCGAGNALVAAMAGLSAATNAACESLAEYTTPHESDCGDGINTAVGNRMRKTNKCYWRGFGRFQRGY